MKRIKIAAIIFIIGAGIIGSYFIIASNDKISGESGLLNEGQNKNSVFGYIKWIKEEFSGEEEKDLSLKSNGEENNITENLIKGIMNSIESEEGTADKNATNEKLFDNAASKYKIDLGLIDFNSIRDFDIKISQNNSKEAKIKYFESLNNINKNRFGNFNKDYLVIAYYAFNKKDFSSAIEAVNIYKNLSADYYKLEVPSNLKDIHKKLISYVKNSEIIYSSMVDYDKDPMKAYLAVEMIQKVVINDTEQLKKDIEEKYKEIN